MITKIPTKIDIKFWFEMARFIIVGVVIIVLAGNLTYFSEIFQNVESKVTGIILWALFILFALRYFQTPDFKRRKGEGYNGKKDV